MSFFNHLQLIKMRKEVKKINEKDEQKLSWQNNLEREKETFRHWSHNNSHVVEMGECRECQLTE